MISIESDLDIHRSKFLTMEFDSIFEKQCNLFTFFPHEYKQYKFSIKVRVLGEGCFLH